MEKEELMFDDEISMLDLKSICDDGPSKLLISFDNTTQQYHHHMQMENKYKSNLDQGYSNLASEIINFSSLSSSSSSTSNSSYKQDSEKIPTTIRSPLQAQEHVMAERKRRQNLSQLFISLSKVVPGLKKLDKASLLEDGINYLKGLQERVGVLEMKKNSIDSDTSKDDSCSSGPEIEARISNKHVLIKVCCKKEMELLMARIGGEMEKIHLNMTDIRIMPFGIAALHITILAQMKSEFKGTVKDIVDHLHTLFFNPTLPRRDETFN